MRIKLLATALMTASVSMLVAQTDTTRMQRAKTSGTYEQTDTSRIRYQAPVNKTMQDTTLRKDGMNNNRNYKSNVRDTTVRRSQDAQQYDGTGSQGEKSTTPQYDGKRNDNTMDGKKTGTVSDKKYVKESTDTSRNMYLIRNDSLNKSK